MVIRDWTTLWFIDFRIDDTVPEFLACKKEVEREGSSFAEIVIESRGLSVLFFVLKLSSFSCMNSVSFPQVQSSETAKLTGMRERVAAFFKFYDHASIFV
jgi:hypothetical protein